MYVALENQDELDLIGLPLIKKRKESTSLQENEKIRKVKFYEYHPEGDFAALISQILSSIIRILIEQVANEFNKNK